MALGRKHGNQTGRDAVFADVRCIRRASAGLARKFRLVFPLLALALLSGCPPVSQEALYVDVRNVEVYGAKATAQLVLCPNDYQPSALLLTLEYDPAELRVISVQPGAAAQSAGKVVDWGITGPGQTTISLVGLNEIAIDAGVLATVGFEGLTGDEEPVALSGSVGTAANAALEDYAEVYLAPLSIAFDVIPVPVLMAGGALLLAAVLGLAGGRRLRRVGGLCLVLFAALAFVVFSGRMRAHAENAAELDWKPPSQRDLTSVLDNVRVMVGSVRTLQGVGVTPQSARVAAMQQAGGAEKGMGAAKSTVDPPETLDFNQSGVVDQRDFAFVMDNVLGRDNTLGLDPVSTTAWPLQVQATLFMRVPVINEMAPASEYGPMDEDGDHPAWLEMGNYTDQPLDLTGFELHVSEELYWIFPETQIPARGCIVVFMSGKNRLTGPNLHTNFAPAANTAFEIALIGPGGEDFLAYVNMPVMDATHSWKYNSFEYASSVTPYSVSTPLPASLMPLMQAAMMVYSSSLENIAMAAALYGGEGEPPTEPEGCAEEYCADEMPTPGDV